MMMTDFVNEVNPSQSNYSQSIAKLHQGPVSLEPAVLDYHGIVRRWRCGSLVTQCPLSLFFVYDVSIVIVYDVTLSLSMTYQFQSRSGEMTSRTYG